MRADSQISAGDVLDELDLALINCLEVEPRAPWRRIGEVLEVDPVTVARRWQRLSETGTAWITGRPAGHHSPASCQAIVEVDCAAADTYRTARWLALRPHVLSVEHTSGNRSLTALIAVPDLASLSRFLMESLGSVPGVRATRSHVVTQVFTTGDQWQLRVLDADQRARLAMDRGRPVTRPASRAASRSASRPADHPGHATRRPPDEADRRLILALGRDGRAPLSELARETGLALSTVRRRLHNLLERQELTLRCDVAHPLAGWPLTLWFWARTHPGDRETAPALVARMPGVRVCLGLTGGEANLLLGIAAHSLYELPAVEARLAREAPRLTVLDSSVVLRFIKRMGRLIDDAGRGTEPIPIDIWGDPAA